MPFFPPRAVRRRRDGTFSLDLPANARAVLAELAEQLRPIVDAAGEGDVDPIVARLFPRAYTDRADLDAEFHELMQSDLAAHHGTALDVVVATAEATVLDDAQVNAWLAALNQMRLALGTRLGIRDDGQQPPDDPDDPDTDVWAIYEFLAWLLDDIVEALDETLGG